jgi:L-galactonate dehydratase
VPVVPHSGGIGLNEYTQHLSLVDYLCVAGKQSMLENITTFNHVLTTPLQTRDGFFVTPMESGYSVEFKGSAITEYSYPEGTFWRSEGGLSIINGRLS